MLSLCNSVLRLGVKKLTRPELVQGISPYAMQPETFHNGKSSPKCTKCFQMQMGENILAGPASEEGTEDAVMVVSLEELYLSWPLTSEMKFMKQKIEPVVRIVSAFICFFSLYLIVILLFKNLINLILDRNLLSLPFHGLLFFFFILCHCVNLMSYS